MRVTIPVRIAGIVSVLGDSLDSRFAAVIGTTLGYLNMPDRRLMPGANATDPEAKLYRKGGGQEARLLGPHSVVTIAAREQQTQDA
jgi:hypothetical protein